MFTAVLAWQCCQQFFWVSVQSSSVLFFLVVLLQASGQFSSVVPYWLFMPSFYSSQNPPFLKVFPSIAIYLSCMLINWNFTTQYFAVTGGISVGHCRLPGIWSHSNILIYLLNFFFYLFIGVIVANYSMKLWMCAVRIQVRRLHTLSDMTSSWPALLSLRSVTSVASCSG